MVPRVLLIWGGFKSMSVKKSSSSPIKKISALKRTLLTITILSVMGWLILLGWACFIWINHSFEAAYQCIQRLSINHTLYMVDTQELPSLTLINDEPTAQILSDVQYHLKLLWALMCAVSYVMFVKFVVLISAIPLFFLSIMAGLIDGLNQRAIRAACLGRESTYVFHKTVPIARKGICWVLGIWLCLPMTLPPTPIFVGLAVMLGFVMRVSASRFKKYL
jgi:integrating conjugative element membrane protein (TIGR03747 family)